jgi:5-methylcytosine-specific restriction endonuclease McrA
VRPLSRGGHEAEYNLVPACGSCNYSKGGRLLTEWDSARVAHGAAHSPAVAAELERDILTSMISGGRA